MKRISPKLDGQPLNIYESIQGTFNYMALENKRRSIEPINAYADKQTRQNTKKDKVSNDLITKQNSYFSSKWEIFSIYATSDNQLVLTISVRPN